jgi:hypothetical protein
MRAALLRPLLAGLVGLAALAASPAVSQTGYGQVQLVNQMQDLTIDLYWDSNYGCRAGPGFTCTTHVPAGHHLLEAKATDGQATSTEIDLASGGTFTYTISPN